MASMTSPYMNKHRNPEAKSQLDPVGHIIDTDDTDLVIPRPARGEPSAAQDRDPFRQYNHPRIQFLRLSSIAPSRQDSQSLTPPYCPVGPSLVRPAADDETPELPTLLREPSPLRHLALTNYSTTVNLPRRRMPHAVSMPQSGFQALVLCGPGIGLSTFTSVPGEYPKALVEIANRPMVWYVLDWCYRMGVTDITLVTPPASKSTMAAALAQNPYLTSLPSPTPDLLAPSDLEYTTPTAELLRLPEIQKAITSDFLLLPCDLICDISGETFLESYLISQGGLGGVGTPTGSDLTMPKPEIVGLSGERSGRRGGLSIWYNTANREESVKGEECDFMCSVKLDHEHSSPLPSSKSNKATGVLRKLVWTMPMSELWDQCEEDKAWKIRQSLLRRHGNVKCMTQYRDSHIYLFPYWVKEFAKLNEDFESVSEDMVGTWAKADWRKADYRARFGARSIFGTRSNDKAETQPQTERPIEEEVDLLSLSSTRITRHPPSTKEAGLQLASRVQADPKNSIISSTEPVPLVPPILSTILPSSPDSALVRRVDTTPLLLSVSLLLAKTPSIDDASNTTSTTSPFAHPSKVSNTATIAPRVTISRSDTLIDSNTTIATQCVIKSSVIGAGVSIGAGSRLTNCVIMSGSTVGEKCVLTGTVVGKKAKIGKACVLLNCEVQDGNGVADSTEGKGEKFLVGGLEDEVGSDNDDDAEEGRGFGEDGDEDEDDEEGDVVAET